jgi:hypothetical protein
MLCKKILTIGGTKDIFLNGPLVSWIWFLLISKWLYITKKQETSKSCTYEWRKVHVYVLHFFFCCRQYSVGFEVITVSENVPNAPGAFKRQTSGDFRWVAGSCHCACTNSRSAFMHSVAAAIDIAGFC